MNSPNVQGIAGVPEIEFLSLGIIVKLNRNPKAEIYSVAGILAMQCCVQYFITEVLSTIMTDAG